MSFSTAMLMIVLLIGSIFMFHAVMIDLMRSDIRALKAEVKRLQNR